MALSEENILDRVELNMTGLVSVRERHNVLFRDGVEVQGSGVYHRYILTPDDDTSHLPTDTRAAINAHWTSERVASWRASLPSDA